jgi:ferritin heavy chain
MAQEGAVSVVRQNYSAEAEAGVNKQINIELYASYVRCYLFFLF